MSHLPKYNRIVSFFTIDCTCSVLGALKFFNTAEIVTRQRFKPVAEMYKSRLLKKSSNILNNNYHPVTTYSTTLPIRTTIL